MFDFLSPKARPIVLNHRGYDVIVFDDDSFADSKAAGAEMKLLLNSCGFGAASRAALERLDPEGLEEMESRLDYAIGDRPWIVASKGAIDALGPEKAMAILDHEVGHIELGHLDSASAESFNDEVKMVDDLNIEIEADAASAEIHGPAVLAAALIDLVVFVGLKADLIPADKRGENLRDEIKDLILERDPRLGPRLRRLGVE